MRVQPLIPGSLLALALAGLASSAAAQQPAAPPPTGPSTAPPVATPTAPTPAAPAASTPTPVAPAATTAPGTAAPTTPAPAGSANADWGFALGPNATTSSSALTTPPATTTSASAPDAYAERAFGVYEMPTLSGSTGLLRVASALSAPVGSFRVQVLWDYFSSNSFLCTSSAPCASGQADHAKHFGATFAASATIMSFLEGYASIRSYANSNDQSSPQLLQVLGDTTLGLKLFLPPRPGRVFHVGADLQLLLLNGSGGIGLDGSGTSVRGRLVSTIDFRQLNAGLPLLVHLNAGYKFDNSGRIVEATEERRGGAAITRPERFGLGINRVDLTELGIGVEGVFSPNKYVRSVRPFAEYTIDIPVNRQGYECAQAQVSSGDQCLGKASGFSTSPSRVSLGVRVNPYLKGLTLTGAFDIGVSAKSNFIEEVAPQAPWSIWWGVGYGFDLVDPPPVIVQAPPPPPLPPVAAPQLIVAGLVHEAGNQQGIPNAVVRFEGRDTTGLVTDGSGHFRTSSLDAGTYTFRVRAEGYKEGTCSVTITSTAAVATTSPTPPPPTMPGMTPAAVPASTSNNTITEVDCALEALPRLGNVVGQVVDAQGGAGVANVTVTLTDPAGNDKTATTDASGNFRFADLTGGSYKLRTQSDAYLGGLGQAEVKPREDAKPVISVNKRPKNSQIVVGKREIVIKQQVHFETGSAKILSDSDVLLQELADVIVRTPKIKRIEIQGHTDNQGTPAINKTLSEQRAQAVRDRLISLGVTSNRLEAHGYGSERPLVPNVTAGNRARNRRVALVILDQDK